MKQFIVITIFLCTWQFCNCYSSFFDPNSRSTAFADRTTDSTTSTTTTTTITAVPDAVCQNPGQMCKNCEELVNCIQVNPNDFIQVPIKNCEAAEQEFCLIDQCSTAPNPQCTAEGAEDFLCHNTGVYPDPSDCRVYHMCVEGKDNLEPTPSAMIHIPVQCDDGYAYNPVSTYCDRRLLSNLCAEFPVDQCKELGQMGPVVGTSIFYVCMEINENLIPHLYMCPAGGKFNDGTCIANE